MYKSFQVEKKRKEEAHEAELKQMSESEARLVRRKVSAEKKRQKAKQEKGDRRFFNLSGKAGLKTGGGKLGKMKGGNLVLSKADLKKLTS